MKRMIEEVDRLKNEVLNLRENQHYRGEEAKGENERLLLENKKLEKFNGELLLAFKKQIKLVDILKRQKVKIYNKYQIHIEAARLLQFTEEEFIKTLELGDKI